MSIGEHKHPSFFQKIELDDLFLFSQDFSVDVLPNQQAAGTVHVFQFADFDGLNIYFGYADFTLNTFFSSNSLHLANSNIISKSSIPPRDTMFGIYKGVVGNEINFGQNQIGIDITPGVLSSAGGKAC